jgi:hypothetical protein
MLADGGLEGGANSNESKKHGYRYSLLSMRLCKNVSYSTRRNA